jgi:hypothetical protein
MKIAARAEASKRTPPLIELLIVVAAIGIIAIAIGNLPGLPISLAFSDLM